MSDGKVKTVANTVVFVGKHVRSLRATDGAVLAQPVFVKVGQNAGWFMTREEALDLAAELADAVNAVRS